MNAGDIVTKSYGRCLAQGNLLFDRFYDLFLKSSPEIAKMFHKTDMKKQKSLLRAGINYAIMFSTDAGRTAAEGVLSRIRDSHSSRNLNVRPELYPLWISMLLKAIEETDPRFTDETRAAWKTVIDNAVGYITAGYAAG